MKKLNGAIFLSGSGSNAAKVLEHNHQTINSAWKPAVIVTDYPEKCMASGKLAAQYSVPLVKHSIREFYKQHGESKVSLATERGQQIRELWTAELRRKLCPFEVDFGILAGFVPLSNITGDFPCLNIHPGDLSVERDGKRLLVGLHEIPVELAILSGFDYLRSSVIVAQPYSGKGGEMDSGPVLALSPKVPLLPCDITLAQFKQVAAQRPARRPVGGFKDALGDYARENLQNLKHNGDWVVFPGAVERFAREYTREK